MEEYEQEVVVSESGLTIVAIFLTGKQNAIDRVMPYVMQRGMELMREDEKRKLNNEKGGTT